MAKNTNTTTTTLSRGTTQDKIQELVRKKAYELYQKRGCTAGNDMADWFEAEKLVKKELGRWF